MKGLSGSASKLGQYFNFQGIKYLFWALRDPVNFKPHLSIDTIDDLDFSALKQNGIEYIVFDKDNTLTVPYKKELYDPIKGALKSCKEVFGHDYSILSNSAGSSDDKDHREAEWIEENFGIQVIRHRYKKPHVRDDILDLKEGMKPEQVCVIGDRILADVVMGNRHGFYTVKTEPFDTSTENVLVKMS
jgi:phosphatidylglycerophosphatase GEP4